jgi:transposase
VQARRAGHAPGLVHLVPPRQLRDLTRYRRTLTQERTREKQRAGKLLEDTQIELSVVISDIFGASGRAMLAALVAGGRPGDPRLVLRLAGQNPTWGSAGCTAN